MQKPKIRKFAGGWKLETALHIYPCAEGFSECMDLLRYLHTEDGKRLLAIREIQSFVESIEW